MNKYIKLIIDNEFLNSISLPLLLISFIIIVMILITIILVRKEVKRSEKNNEK